MRLTSVCGDLNEPDNEESFSGTRLEDEAIAGHTCTAQDLDWFRISARPGQRLDLAITKPGQTPVDVLLYQDNTGQTPGSLIEMRDMSGENWGASMRDSGSLSLDIPPSFSAGDIYVRVRLEEPGAYEVTASWQ